MISRSIDAHLWRPFYNLSREKGLKGIKFTMAG
ncbi:hypothetical protein GGI1_18521, partial [Acidithiobacillus sp. GGI-221]